VAIKEPQDSFMTNSRSKKYRPVIVDWVDAVADIRSQPSSLPTMQSVGFLFKKDRERLILVNLTPPDFDITHCVSISIPVGIVKRITYLNERVGSKRKRKSR